MTYRAMQGFLQSLQTPPDVDTDSVLHCIACVDNEEIGSLSAQGANSDLLPSVLRRLDALKFDQENSPTAYDQSMAKSMLVSADMAQSVNPNYSAKYESKHCPKINQGTVLKINASMRYATDSPGIAIMQGCARRAVAPSGVSGQDTGVPLHVYVVRNDSPCGSTIGPMLAAKLGVRTVDVGNAQLSMHSIRETCGYLDIEYSTNLFSSFFHHYGELQRGLEVD